MMSSAIARYLLGLAFGLLVIVVALQMVKSPDPVYGVYAVLIAYVGGAIVSRLLWME